MTQHRTTRSLSRSVRTASLAVLPAVAAVGALTSPAASATTRPGLSCGTVVTTDVRLTADLRDCPGSGLIVGAPGITIDLAGYVIDGTGSGAGIDNEAGHDNVRVTRGTVREFTFGINLFQADNARIDRVVAAQNADGFKIARSAGAELDRVAAVGNAAFGVEITFSSGVTVHRSTAADNGISGIVDRFSTDSRHLDNTATGNGGAGLTIDGVDRAVVKRNHLAANEGDGIEAIRASDTQIDQNTATRNQGNGIFIDTDGSTVTANRAVDNTLVGIAAAPGTIDGGNNRANGNGGGDCTGIVCR